MKGHRLPTHVCARQHTPAHVCARQHMPAHVCTYQLRSAHTCTHPHMLAHAHTCQHTPARLHMSICTSAHICGHARTLANSAHSVTHLHMSTHIYTHLLYTLPRESTHPHTPAKPAHIHTQPAHVLTLLHPVHTSSQCPRVPPPVRDLSTACRLPRVTGRVGSLPALGPHPCLPPASLRLSSEGRGRTLSPDAPRVRGGVLLRCKPCSFPLATWSPVPKEAERAASGRSRSGLFPDPACGQQGPGPPPVLPELEPRMAIAFHPNRVEPLL